MPLINSITLLVNGLTLAMSLGFLIVILWQDPAKTLYQFFAFFLFMMTLWSVGSLLTLAISIIEGESQLIGVTISIMEVGFTGSSVALYVFTAILVNAYKYRFRRLALLTLFIFFGYQVFLFLLGTGGMATGVDGLSDYRFQDVSIWFYVVFTAGTIYFLWRYRRRITSTGIKVGLALFAVGQLFGLLNPELQTLSIAIVVCSVAVLIMGLSILRQEVIIPLRERITQVEAMHKVSLAISSQLSVETVLSQIATRAAGWLNADGVGIFLENNGELELATVYELPASFVGWRLAMGDGVAGCVAATQQSIRLENYGRDWKEDPDLPLAKETFGSTICVPLVYGGHAIGALMVIAGKHGRTFQHEDVHLLELLGAQAAVALAHGRLFTKQGRLAYEIEAARNQLETVLTSTENPVVAVDRDDRVIFANKAAQRLFPHIPNSTRSPLSQVLPEDVLPKDQSAVLRDVRHRRSHVYEFTLNGRYYLCNLATLGADRIEGWVAVLNDVTQLKELDRIKSEIIRMTSHDLKNPLQAAMANLDLLVDAVSDGDTSEAQTSIAGIDKQLNRMSRIISGILDLERIKLTQQSQQPVSPAQLLDNVHAEMIEFARDRQVEMVIEVRDGLPSLTGDGSQLERALINLVENAIKFSPPNGRVTISVSKEDENLLFAVQDEGVGIPEADQERVFDRFFRANQRGTEHVSGSGLGLSLVKTVVDNHKGVVWLESTENEGSTFFVSLPSVADGMMTSDPN